MRVLLRKDDFLISSEKFVTAKFSDKPLSVE